MSSEKEKERDDSVTSEEGTPTVAAPPEKRIWRGLKLPIWFQPESAEQFIDMEAFDDDVFMSSMPKGGTTWMHKILFLMLFGIDEEGKEIQGTTELLRKGSKYPEFLPIERPTEPRGPLGLVTYGDIMNQPQRPRFFDTHLFGPRFLPKSVVSKGGKGKVVVVLRNLKDVMVSNHFFFGEPKDGFLGNEHGKGSLARFVSEEETGEVDYAYGSPFTWVKDSSELLDVLEPEGRGLCVYFEDLKKDLPAQLERIAAFLGRPLPQAKREAIQAAVGFSAMKADGITSGALMRKGEIGDWENHMTLKDWERVDMAFEKTLANVRIAQPMRQYMMPKSS